MKIKHNKYFYEKGRNGWTPPNTKEMKNKVNPKMKMSKEELGIKDQYHGKTISGGLENDSRVPEYYKGRDGYEARKVCDNFNLTYHLATATTYILRAYRKHDSPVECLTKAIAHLEFELEKIRRENG